MKQKSRTPSHIQQADLLVQFDKNASGKKGTESNSLNHSLIHKFMKRQ